MGWEAFCTPETFCQTVIAGGLRHQGDFSSKDLAHEDWSLWLPTATEPSAAMLHSFENPLFIQAMLCHEGIICEALKPNIYNGEPLQDETS